MRLLCLLVTFTVPLLCVGQIDYVDRNDGELNYDRHSHSNDDDHYDRHSSSSSEENNGRSSISSSEENNGRSSISSSEEDNARSSISSSEEDNARSSISSSEEDNARSSISSSEEDNERSSISSSEEDNSHKCNDLVYEGSHSESNVDSYEAITSPNFPEPYPTDDEFDCTYHIQNVAGGHVRLIFDDFLLSSGDFITIRDEWFSRFEFTEDERPFSIVSRNSFLIVKFKSKGNSNKATGYKARYTFTEDRLDWSEKPFVRQSVLAHPSSIFIASNPCQRPIHTDYIWILRGFEDMGLAIGIEEMFFHADENGRGGTTLQIHDGPTSEAPLIAEIRRPGADFQQHRSISRSSTVYVRLRSEMYHGDKLLGTFASITQPDDTGRCPDDFFRCDDGSCIYHDVVCDGLNQCGDHSDENECKDKEQTTPSHESYCDRCVHHRQCFEDRMLCDCEDGYHGNYCQYEDDLVYTCDQCQNGAHCRINIDGSLECQCQRGYYGTYCEYLQEDKCRFECYNGKCTDEGECKCHKGYYGNMCENEEEPVDDCGGCMNGGYCQSGGYCVCSFPHYGSHCERDRYTCDGGCWHGGICEYGSCSCKYGYYGDRCQFGPDAWYDDLHSETKTISGWFIGGMVVASLLIILLVVATCIAKRRCCGSTAEQSKEKITPYTVSDKLKYTVDLSTRFDECHGNSTYESSEKDNISLPPSYDDISIYSNNPYTVKDVTNIELHSTKGNEAKPIVPPEADK
ncbi:uncharacterized protein LOC102807984 [Saccoglossus kowalevskii]